MKNTYLSFALSASLIITAAEFPSSTVAHAQTSDIIRVSASDDECENIEDRYEQKDCYRSKNAASIQQWQQSPLYQMQMDIQREQNVRAQEIIARERERREAEAAINNSTYGGNAVTTSGASLQNPSQNRQCPQGGTRIIEIC